MRVRERHRETQRESNTERRNDIERETHTHRQTEREIVLTPQKLPSKWLGHV